MDVFLGCSAIKCSHVGGETECEIANSDGLMLAFVSGVLRPVVCYIFLVVPRMSGPFLVFLVGSMSLHQQWDNVSMLSPQPRSWREGFAHGPSLE